MRLAGCCDPVTRVLTLLHLILSPSASLCTCLSLSVLLRTFLCVCLFLYLSFSVSAPLFVCISLCLPCSVFVFLCVCLFFVCISLCLPCPVFVFLCVCLAQCLYFSVSALPSVCISLCLPHSLSVGDSKQFRSQLVEKVTEMSKQFRSQFGFETGGADGASPTQIATATNLVKVSSKLRVDLFTQKP